MIFHRIVRFLVRHGGVVAAGLAGIILVGSLGGCAAIQEERRKEEGRLPADMSGMASWYGAPEGAETASGEGFRAAGFTAAHRTLPFGTIVRVTRTDEGQAVEVRINDRGPFHRDRVIDVSPAAADKLDLKAKGLAPVRLEIVKPAPGATPPATGGGGAGAVGGGAAVGGADAMTFTVQFGAFSNPDAADTMRRNLAGAFPDAFVVKQGDLHKVRVGKKLTSAQAQAIAEKARAAGHTEALVLAEDGK